MLKKPFADPLNARLAQTDFQTVYLVNPDMASNSVVTGHLASAQVGAKIFRAPSELLNSLPLSPSSCLITEFVLPEINGLQLLDQLRRLKCFNPVIFMSTRMDENLLMAAVNKGAFGFLKKPFDSIQMIDMVQRALNHNMAIMPIITRALRYIRSRETLSGRESNILGFLELGWTAREIADELDLSIRTVENHRLRIFRKMSIRKSRQIIENVTIVEVLRAQGYTL